MESVNSLAMHVTGCQFPHTAVRSINGSIMSGQWEPINRDTVLLDYGFLLGIDANRVKSELRDRLINYQRECYQELAAAETQITVSVVYKLATYLP